MKDDAPGTAKSAKLVKAGCGIRFDPETLSEDTGFNFDAAKDLLDQVQMEAAQATPPDAGDDDEGRALEHSRPQATSPVEDS